ncbi:ABC transporter permease [Paenibacillus donghaensis]|uniref:ABC transporter permease n=1 Tax=Paenibacillus donghaensis TaxID=414771 RepID=UPI0012FE2B35|nr:ABC transporter permease [Paenibacillus donghaensis]
MNTLRIAYKEIKHGVRDWGTMLFMLAFPLALILILGLTLTNAFESGVDLAPVKVLVQDSSSNVELSKAFRSFSDGMERAGVQTELAAEGVDGRTEVELNRYADYIELRDDGILLYASSRSGIESNIVQGLLSSFTDRHNLAAVVAQSAPERLNKVFTDLPEQSYIREVAVNSERTPTSLDYYAVAMTAMIGLWSALPASGLIRSEISRGTAQRLAIAPVSRGEILTGKLLGSFVINTLCVLLLILVSKYGFGAYWGERAGEVLLILLSEITMAISLGLACGYVMKGAASQGIVLVILQVASLAGGAFFPVSEGGGLLGWLVNWSPMHWTHQALTAVINGNTNSGVWGAIGLNLGLAVLFLGSSIIILRQREGI